MKTHNIVKLVGLLVVCSLLSGCGAGSGSASTYVWIDVPLDGLAFPSVQAIKIEGHASSSGSISRVEIWINSVLLTTVNDPPMEGGLAAFHTEWTPSAPGEYTIQAVAFSANGTASEADSARVTFGGVSVTPVIGCPTPIGGGPTPVSCLPEVSGCPSPVGGGPTPVSCASVVTDTPTPSPPVGAVVQFWADPAEIEAGACTTIRWHVENVQRVIFGGIDQPFDGSYEDCLCDNQRYSLGIVYLDGSDEKRTVDIAVNGSCATPTTPPDTTPPPTPSPAVPADGLSIACKGSQSLVWMPVEDPGGIAEYQVEVQRHSGNNKWQDAPGGQISVGGKTTNVSVECGWYYRWRVRAIDGNGNASGWSGWSQFAITLS